ncbi:MAG TPA: crosslink repair DNA glycosylase YcaQ family protein [Mycobacteriales bacterium]|nr:crosslink repair DNA glycosylase YcaQ family protein [Mycobacteriales bacterium]
MPAASSLSAAQARRLALAAQGLARPRAAAQPDRRHLRKLLGQTQVLQIDSVNVLMRAHYLPGWSRLGAYDRSLLDRLAYRDRELFEYWGHEASLIPVELHPLFRWRMRRAEEKFETWGRMARLAQERPGYVDHVLSLVQDGGPLSAGDIAAAEKRSSDNWGWNWSDEKTALEFLFWTGRVTAADRRNFERIYDVTERVIPPAVLALPTPTEEEAHRRLLLLAARACGVGTAGDLADYFRIRTPQARPRLAELVEDGRLEVVQVDGWRQPAYLLPGTSVPRRADARALLVPFDPLIWERDRTERLFGFRFRIEIYVPAAQRVHGYYVLPFLLGDGLVARVDLKSDRAAGALLVQAAYAEPGAPAETAEALAAELAGLAGWLGLSGVRVSGRGDLGPALAAAISG